EGAPPALLHDLAHDHVVHEVIVFLSIVTADTPRVPEAERLQISIAPCIWRLVGRHGFMEEPDAPDLLLHSGLLSSLREVTFFLGHEHLLLSDGHRLRRWLARVHGAVAHLPAGDALLQHPAEPGAWRSAPR